MPRVDAGEEPERRGGAAGELGGRGGEPLGGPRSDARAPRGVALERPQVLRGRAWSRVPGWPRAEAELVPSGRAGCELASRAGHSDYDLGSKVMFSVLVISFCDSSCFYYFIIVLVWLLQCSRFTELGTRLQPSHCLKT